MTRMKVSVNFEMTASKGMVAIVRDSKNRVLCTRYACWNDEAREKFAGTYQTCESHNADIMLQRSHDGWRFRQRDKYGQFDVISALMAMDYRQDKVLDAHFRTFLRSSKSCMYWRKL